MNILSIFCEIAIRWMPQHLTDNLSTLVQVMAWCRQATSHYLRQCWPTGRSLSPYDVTRPKWVKNHHYSLLVREYCNQAQSLHGIESWHVIAGRGISISDKTSYHKISLRLKAARSVSKVFHHSEIQHWGLNKLDTINFYNYIVKAI